MGKHQQSALIATTWRTLVQERCTTTRCAANLPARRAPCGSCGCGWRRSRGGGGASCGGAVGAPPRLHAGSMVLRRKRVAHLEVGASLEQHLLDLQAHAGAGPQAAELTIPAILKAGGKGAGGCLSGHGCCEGGLQARGRPARGQARAGGSLGGVSGRRRQAVARCQPALCLPPGLHIVARIHVILLPTETGPCERMRVLLKALALLLWRCLSQLRRNTAMTTHPRELEYIERQAQAGWRTAGASDSGREQARRSVDRRSNIHGCRCRCRKVAGGCAGSGGSCGGAAQRRAADGVGGLALPPLPSITRVLPQ